MAEFLASSTLSGVKVTPIERWPNGPMDPDVDVPAWLTGSTPIGILHPITPRGIFPLDDSAAESADEL